MISKIQNTGVHFNGQLLPSKELKDAFNYAKEAAYSEDNKFAATEFANAVNYILKETPEEDVFQLVDNGHSNSVSLTRNGKRVTEFDNFDRRISAFEALRMFIIGEKNTALTTKTPSMQPHLEVIEDIRKLDEEYKQKRSSLESRKQDLYDRIGLEGLKMVRAVEKKLGL